MTRHLATIQTISEITPIDGADKIETAKVLGWRCIVEKGKYKVGDKVIYCEIDSVLPESPEFEFLRKSCYVDNGIVKGFRIKTIKLRKQVSQGLILPLSHLDGKKYNHDERENPVYDFHEGKDVSDLISITQFEKPIPACMSGKVKGQFPGFIPKTDETRVQVLQNLLKVYEGTKCYVTEKIDGTSTTFYFKDGEFGVCSRSLELSPDDPTYHEKPKFIKRSDGKIQVVDENGEPIGEPMDDYPVTPKVSENIYWKMARKYDVENRLRKLGRNIAIQGETYGEGLQKNPLKVKDQHFAIFNIYDIDKQTYLSISEMYTLLIELNKYILADAVTLKIITPNLELVPILTGIIPSNPYIECEKDYNPQELASTQSFVLISDIDKLVELSKGNSVINRECKREGIVIRPIENLVNNNYSEECKAGRISFKVINPDYLIANDE